MNNPTHTQGAIEQNLALSLLMFWVDANDANHTPTMNNFALITHFFD
jgi:hypothetical protein